MRVCGRWLVIILLNSMKMMLLIVNVVRISERDCVLLLILSIVNVRVIDDIEFVIMVIVCVRKN